MLNRFNRFGRATWTTVRPFQHAYLPCVSCADMERVAAPRLKLLDGFQLFLMLSGIAQFLYCIIVTNFPFNAFIAGCVFYYTLLASASKKRNAELDVI